MPNWTIGEALADRLAAIVPDGFHVQAAGGMLWYSSDAGRFPGQISNYQVGVMRTTSPRDRSYVKRGMQQSSKLTLSSVQVHICSYRPGRPSAARLSLKM